MDLWTESQGPPRKRMRKGTKSCIECRRRKIRCTYKPDRPEACNECRLRGSTCVDQENGAEDTSDLAASGQPERYSLRERVAHLETVVQDLAKRLNETTAANSALNLPTGANLTPTSIESDKLGPSSDQIENAPVMQLFDNYLVGRRDNHDNIDQFTGAKDSSPKARAVRAELLALLPSANDINKIINSSSKFWSAWEENLPELRQAFESTSIHNDSSVAPADIAKALVCLSLTMMLAPTNFDFNALQKPLDPVEWTARCTAVVGRLVVRDDDFATTLPGIETQMLISRVHTHEGRLRKAWLVNRRAIEYAHLAGMHLSTRTSRPLDALYERRLKLWCSLATFDRSLSLMLGLPYGVAEAFVLPQIQTRLNSTIPPAEQYELRIGLISGHMIDRNQNPAELCLESTLRLDQELMDVCSTLPANVPQVDYGRDELDKHIDWVPLQFMPMVLRALLHMPFMLKYPRDLRFSHCHQMAIQSAREGLALYKVRRSITRSYLCKVIDFMAFTMGMLLIVHLNGYSEESPGYSKAQDESDWQLVGEVAEMLRQATPESSNSVAAESASILGAIYNSRNQEQDWSSAATCKITVPYFGTITVGTGSKFARSKSRDQEADLSRSLTPALSSSKQTPSQSYTPPMSDPGVAASKGNADALNDNVPMPGANFLVSGEDPAIHNLAGLESNLFTGLFDDFGQYVWPNANLDMGLDQGWNLNWFEYGN